VRAILAQSLDVGDPQFVAGHTEVAQTEILGDGVVLAVASALPQGLDRRFPVIDLMPQVDIFHVVHLLIEKQVHHPQLFQLRGLLLGRQQVLPGIDPLLACAQRPVQRFGAPADEREVPVGLQAAQQ